MMTACTQQAKQNELTCTVNESAFIAGGGWNRLETADRWRVSELVRKGKAVIEYHHGTLICTAWIDGKPFPDMRGGILYWKRS